MRSGFCSFVLAALCLAGSLAEAQPTSLRAWNTHPDGYPVTEAMKSFIQEVDTATKGKYKIELFSNAVLGDQTKAVAMLKAGEIDVAEFNSAPLSEAAPGLKAFNLPFLFTDSAHMFRYLDGETGARLEEALKASGYVVLGWYDGGARSFYCANKPMTKRDDLIGQRVRVQQSEVYIEMVKLLGAIPVVVPYKEVLDGFQKGTIDCAEGNMASYEATGHYKAAKYMLLDSHMISPEALVVSNKLWNRLTAEEKIVFQKAGKKSAVLMRELWEKRIVAARAAMTKEGVQFSNVQDFSPYIRKMSPLYTKYMADPATRGALFAIVGNQ
jgi:tripartite ATP-independent transporter DctP family solute receptor